MIRNFKPIISTRKSLCFFILFIHLFSGFLHAEPYQIIVQGNDNSDEQFIAQLTLKCIDNQNVEKTEMLEIKALRSCILNSKLFSEVEINQDNEKITVSVEERWTLIPIPIVSSDSGGETSYGLFLMETNFLGMGKTLALGGVFSDTNNMLFLMYKDPAVFNSDWGFQTQMGIQTSEAYLYDGNDKVDGIHEESTFYGASIGYAFSRELSSRISFNSVEKKFKKLDDYPEPEDFKVNTVGISGVWDNSRFKFYYQEGFSVKLGAKQQIDRNDEGDLMQTFALDANWQANLIAQHALQVGVGLANSNHAERKTALKVGSQVGMRGIPSGGVWAKSFGTLAIDYNIPLSSSDSGTWTVAPFYDTGRIQMINDSDKTVDYSAYGVGTYYYLKQIAIPGIGLYIGTNDTYQDTFFSFTIGFRFN